MVMSGLFFPRTPYGVAWGVEKYVEDVASLGKYNFAEAVWRVLVESLDEMQNKLASGEVSDVQMSGFTLLIQVCCEKLSPILILDVNAEIVNVAWNML